MEYVNKYRVFKKKSAMKVDSIIFQFLLNSTGQDWRKEKKRIIQTHEEALMFHTGYFP